RIAHLASLAIDLPLAPRGIQPGAQVVVSLRPEHLVLVRSGSGVNARVSDVLFLGSSVTCVLERGTIKLIAKLSPTSGDVPALGDEVVVGAELSAAVVFDAKGRIG